MAKDAVNIKTGKMPSKSVIRSPIQRQSKGSKPTSTVRSNK